MKAKLLGIIALFSTLSIQAITIVSPEGAGNERILLARIAQQADELTVIHEANESMIEALGANLTTVDGKIDTIDSIVDAVSANVSTIDNKVDTVDTVINRIETDTISIEGKVDTIDGIVDTINTNVSTINGKINTVDTVVDGIATDMATNFAGTWSAIDAIESNAIQLSNADASGGTITISSSGSYELTQNITNKILIEASNVDLNLKGYTVSRSNGSDNIITIGINNEKISVSNGMIENTSGSATASGLLVNNGSAKVCLENLKIYDCKFGIKLDGSSGSEITECTIKDCDLNGNTIGITLDYSDENVIENCTATHSTQAGFDLSNSEGNHFKNCKALRTIGTGATISGFVSENGNSNLFENCLANRTETSNASFSSKVCGFLLTGTETETKLSECHVQETVTLAAGDAVSYEAVLYPIILETDDLLVPATSDNTPTSTFLDIHWSPDEKYIATADANNQIRIFTFDDSTDDPTLAHLYNKTLSGVQSIAWSPDGTQLAAGTSTTVEIYEFNNFTISENCSFAGPGTQVNILKWSPDGNYLAIGYNSGNLRVVGFTGSEMLEIDSDSTMDSINNMSWSSCGNYIACAGANDGGSQTVYVFSFDETKITPIDDYTLSVDANSVAWSPNAKYIAVRKDQNYFDILSFNGTTLTPVTSYNFAHTKSLQWSPDGQYILAASSYSSGASFDLYEMVSFNGSTCSSVKTIARTEADQAVYISWPKSGTYIVGAITSNSGNYVRVYDAMQTPKNCLLDVNNFSTSDISNYNTCNFKYGSELKTIETAVDNIASDLTTIEGKVDTLDTLVDGIPSDIATNFAETWTTIEAIGCTNDDADNSATQLSNADASGGTITISSSGTYELSENITNKIVINANNVNLNLKEFTVSRSVASDNIITINSSKEKISIYNGIVENTNGSATGAGLLVNNSAAKIHVENLKIYECGIGAKLNGSDGNEIAECNIKNCDFVASATGLLLNYADENVIENCTATHNTQAGFALSNSEANLLKSCKALKTNGSATTVAGFVSENGNANIFKNSSAQKTNTSATSFASKVCGFLLNGTETATKLINCDIQKTESTASGDAVAYGVALYPTILPTNDLLVEVASDNTPTSTILDIHWSPDEKYVATADEGNEVRVFKFNSTSETLSHLDNQTLTGVKAIAWSPDGTQLAIGTSTTVEVYEFDGFIMSANCSYTGPGTQVNKLKWSPDGAYLAIGYDSGNLRVVGFTGSSMIEIATDTTTMVIVADLDWSPSGDYIACAARSGSSGYIWVFSFDATQLAPIDSYMMSAVPPNAVSWSPNGKYIASHFRYDEANVLSFNGSTLSSAAFYISGSGWTKETIKTFDWSPDGQYILASFPGDDYYPYSIAKFDGTTCSIKTTSPEQVEVVNNAVVSWSSSGKYIAAADTSSLGNFVRILDAMNAPQNCLLDDNNISNSNATGQLASFGILGGGRNLFAQNISGYNTHNYSYGVPNTYFGSYNTQKPFDNISVHGSQ